jgi:hypothetical protein
VNLPCFLQPKHSSHCQISNRVDDSYGKAYTFVIQGPEGRVLGEGDQHDTKYDHVRFHANFASGTGSVVTEAWLQEGHCRYVMDMYATDEFLSTYETNKPAIYAICVAMIFIFTLAISAIYDWNVSRRQSMVMSKAMKTQAVVSSLFPKSVQDRIMQDVENQVVNENKRGSRKDQLKSFLSSEGNNDSNAMGSALQNSKSIADLFVSAIDMRYILYIADSLFCTHFDIVCTCLSYQPEATIIFSDIVWFTAWSSTREEAAATTSWVKADGSFSKVTHQQFIDNSETLNPAIEFGSCFGIVALDLFSLLVRIHT